MERIINKNTSNFIVTNNYINNNKTLLPNVLYKKMETFVLKSVSPFEHVIISKPALKKLNILKNAFLNDSLQLSSNIKKLDKNELQITVEVVRSDSCNDVICNAFFSFLLKENSVKKVS
ncbi:MAG: hypothetical protein COA67_12070 [Lutibacter sp.]|nr:MAG: hypothetical protein COA67_12070 [Lutibacter sp.]